MHKLKLHSNLTNYLLTNLLHKEIISRQSFAQAYT